MLSITKALLIIALAQVAFSAVHSDNFENTSLDDSSITSTNEVSQTAIASGATSKAPSFIPSTLKTSPSHVWTTATLVDRQASSAVPTIPTVTISTSATSQSSTSDNTIPIAVSIVAGNALILLAIVVFRLVKRKRSARQRLRETSIGLPQHEPSPHDRPMSQASLLPLNPTPQSIASSQTTSSDPLLETPLIAPGSTTPTSDRPSFTSPSTSASSLPEMLQSGRTTLSQPISRTPSIPPYTSVVRQSETVQSFVSTLASAPATSRPSSIFQPAPAYQPSPATRTSSTRQSNPETPRLEAARTSPVSRVVSSSNMLNGDGFHVAVICARGFEADRVEDVFDEKFNGPMTIDPRDPNAYKLGRIGRHNVVLVVLPSSGLSAASTAACNLPWTFKNIKMAFVVGICGIVPVHPKTKQEIILGDCIISTDVINLDRGRQNPGGFERSSSISNAQGRGSVAMRSFLTFLDTSGITKGLELQLSHHLEKLQAKLSDMNGAKLHYPGAHRDHLYEADYRHCHDWEAEHDDQSSERETSCRALGCDPDRRVPRERLISSTGENPEHRVKIHFGLVGSADKVQKSGLHRQEIARNTKAIAFEMEAAGVKDTLPDVIVIKSGSDYSDSHKNDDWQPYAAATAACGLKAVLERWNPAGLSSAPLLLPRRPLPLPIASFV